MLHILGLIFALLPFTVVFHSCQSNSLVGEWTYEAFEQGHNVKIVYTFLKDKTYIQSTSVDGNACPSIDGTYSREGDLVILKPKVSRVIKGRLKNDRLVLTMEEGGVYEAFRTFDITLTKNEYLLH